MSGSISKPLIFNSRFSWAFQVSGLGRAAAGAANRWHFPLIGGTEDWLKRKARMVRMIAFQHIVDNTVDKSRSGRGFRSGKALALSSGLRLALIRFARFCNSEFAVIRLSTPVWWSAEGMKPFLIDRPLHKYLGMVCSQYKT